MKTHTIPAFIASVSTGFSLESVTLYSVPFESVTVTYLSASLRNFDIGKHRFITEEKIL